MEVKYTQEDIDRAERKGKEEGRIKEELKNINDKLDNILDSQVTKDHLEIEKEAREALEKRFNNAEKRFWVVALTLAGYLVTKFFDYVIQR